MNLAEYIQKHRTEPAHLRSIREHTKLRLACERKDAKQSEANRAIDRELDKWWTEYKAGRINEDDLRHIVFRACFHWHFGRLPEPGPSKQISSEKLERLQNVVFESFWTPDVTGEDPRTKTIFDFDGINYEGKPQSYSQFIHNIVNNKHRRLRKGEWELKKEQGLLEIQINTSGSSEDSPRDGSVRGDEITRYLPKPILSDKDFDGPAKVPVDLRNRLALVVDRYAAEFPHLIGHFLLGTSALAIETLLKAGGNMHKPGGRKTISQVQKDFDAELHEEVLRFVRSQSWFTPGDEDKNDEVAILRDRQRLAQDREAVRILESWKMSMRREEPSPSSVERRSA